MVHKEEPWHSPHEMFETFINLMAENKGNPPISVDFTDLPVGMEITIPLGGDLWNYET